MAWSAGAVLTAAQLNTYLPQAWSTWTPTVTASAGTFTTVSGAGRYIQYGKTVHWSATITITTVGTASGSVIFTLPVTARAASEFIGGGRENVATGRQVNCRTDSTTLARVNTYDFASAHIGAGYVLILSGTYEAA